MAALVRLCHAYAGANGPDISATHPDLDPNNLFEYVLNEKLACHHSDAESRTAESNAAIARRCAQAIERRFYSVASDQRMAIDAAVDHLAAAVARLFDAIDQDARLREELRKRHAPGKPPRGTPGALPAGAVRNPPGRIEDKPVK
jgi:hypothetical protein